VKLPTSPPSHASLTTLTNWGKSLASSIAAGWNKEHKSDGTHKAITADSLTATGAISGGTGSIGGALSAESLTISDTNVLGTGTTVLTATGGTAGLVQSATVVDGTSGNAYGLYVDTPTASTINGGTIASSSCLTVGPAASTAGTDYTAFLGTGTVMAESGYSERLRTTPMGEWQAVSFAAGNFTGNGTMTWGVDSGDIGANRYTLVGKTMTWNLSVATSDVGGVANTELRATVPGGFTCAVASYHTAAVAIDAGASTTARVETVGGQAYVRIVLAAGGNWTITAADNTYVYFTITFEVQ
jgi:hypothetical protein